MALNFDLELSNARLTITHLHRVIQAHEVEVASKENIIRDRDELNVMCIEKDRLVCLLREKSNNVILSRRSC